MPPLRRPWQFSIASLFVVTTLVAICAAAWVFNPFAGIWTTVIVVSVFATVWRTRAALAKLPAQSPGTFLAGAATQNYLGSLAVSIALVFAANVAFVSVCTPVTAVIFIGTDGKLGGSGFLSFLVFAFGVACGLAAVIVLLWLTWPKRAR